MTAFGFEYTGARQNTTTSINTMLLPEGEYIACVTNITDGYSKAGTYRLLTVDFQLADDVYRGKKLKGFYCVGRGIDNLNAYNDIAVNIGQDKICRLANACGFGGLPPAMENLYNKHFKLVIAIKEREGVKENEIKGFKKLTNNIPAQPQNAAPVMPMPAPQVVAQPTIQLTPEDIPF